MTLRVGLSGGIGSGKSTVSARLAELGAVVVDADAVAREVVEPGMPALEQIAERFGPDVLAADGSLDRPALGRVVFANEQARRDLEAITHPQIRRRSAELMDAAPDDAVVVHDIPLLVEMGLAADYALTVIVDVPEEERLRRLVELRGMDEQAARSRITAQADDAARAAAADVLLDNSGTVEELHEQVDRLWQDRLLPFERWLRAGEAARAPEELVVVPPDPTWPAQAERLLARLRAAVPAAALVRADHIGSTSVPGLAAKDVVDLQLVVRDLGDLDDEKVRSALARRGFVTVHDDSWDHAHPGPAGLPRDSPETWPKRLLGDADPARVTHVHVRSVDSPAWTLALLFRDWLRAVPDERDRYARLKAGHVAAGTPRKDYAQAKEPWFAEAFVRARAWGDAAGWHPA
ncbi:Dephospho-CoA kinase [Serinicoccus hydrothermalis]|uniref:Dephospho-CoA kinase n=1 Tax=Serinicoccus hydrothermalis TaxID=1758689 RepID=A0A1B1NA96_9MICO|nr:dephospho-CoA kinase [Serinicoccus hydrothermalis]ANS78295.1 Dephospho-CoA kinase [Serinicoccus hydrothermalis]